VLDVIGLHGVEEGRPDDPMWLVPASPLDMPAIAGPLSKDRREDLQVWGFLLAAAAQSEGQHPLGVRRGEDPPDRYVQGPEREWALELTELTVGDVRIELARARAVGRRLQEALRADSGRHGHLVGRRVVLSLLPQPDKPLPRDPASIIAALADVLAEDQGCVADGVDLSQGLPDRWPSSSGFYGQHGPFIVQVYRDGIPGVVTVSSSAQVQIHRSEALAALAARVEAKDRPTNDLLLITCGMPDEWGYVCPLEGFIFRFIAEEATRGLLLPSAPRHLVGVVLHSWGTLEWGEVYGSASAAPWTTEAT
jgi:hypothetical protein